MKKHVGLIGQLVFLHNIRVRILHRTMFRILSAALLACFVSFLGCEWMESSETSYANLDAAQKANAVGPGKWIPEFLPSSARNILEKHNLDTNEIWLSFHTESGDLGSILSACKEVTGESILLPRASPGHWWPKTLVRHSGGSKQLEKGFVYFQCQDRGSIATDLKRIEVFYWVTMR